MSESETTERRLPEGFRWANDLPSSRPNVSPVPFVITRPRRQVVEETLEINTLREALNLFRSKLPVMVKERDISFEGARIGAVHRHTLTQARYLVLFKREFYKKFGAHFPNVVDKGYGILCAKKLVAWAVDERLNIASVFSDGHCYYISASDFWFYYEENKTDCPHVPGEIAMPIKMLRRLF